MLTSNNQQWNDNHDCQNPSQDENLNRDVEKLISQDDAIYDYERVPPTWRGLDDSSNSYEYGHAVSEVEHVGHNGRSARQ